MNPTGRRRDAGATRIGAQLRLALLGLVHPRRNRSPPRLSLPDILVQLYLMAVPFRRRTVPLRTRIQDETLPGTCFALVQN